MKLGFMFLTTIVVSWVNFAHSASAVRYVPGWQLAAESTTEPDLIFGRWVKVPVDYLNPNAGQTSIYYTLGGKLNSAQPTLVFLDGGPGSSPRRFYQRMSQLSQTLAVNVVLMEPRGVGFSRPDHESLYSDPAFYSSNFVARDLELVRQNLGIEKWTVWGVSYGSIPATIYASLFPEHTRAVLLEGVVYDNWAEHGVSVYISRILNRHLMEKLSLAGRKNLDFIQYHGRLSRLVFQSMYFMGTRHFERIVRFLDSLQLDSDLSRATLERLVETNGAEADENLIQHLRATLDRIVATFIELVTEAVVEDLNIALDNTLERARIRASVSRMLKQDSASAFDDLTVFGMLLHRESGVALGFKELHFNEQTGFFPQRAQRDLPEEVSGLLRSLAYRAQDYPLRVPTYYFQGLHDPATNGPQAIRHYKNVAQGPKHLFLFKADGHSPNVHQLFSEGPVALLWQKVFKETLMGQQPSGQLIAQFNQQAQRNVKLVSYPCSLLLKSP